jgi:hypothetical protein
MGGESDDGTAIKDQSGHSSLSTSA